MSTSKVRMRSTDDHALFSSSVYAEKSSRRSGGQRIACVNAGSLGKLHLDYSSCSM